MLRTTKNELLIGFTISVILSLFANFALIMQHYELVTNSPAGDVALKQGKIELWFPLLWLFFFSFVLFILCRWIYRLGIRRFHKEVKTLGLATGICLLVACGLYKAFPFIRKSVMTQIHSDSFCVTEQAVSLSRVWTSTTPAIEKKDTLANTSPDRVHRGVIGAMTVTSNSYPLIIEHIFILLTVLLTMLLLHLFDKKQEMKLEYEKIKVKQLQSSYNALMGQINPHFFLNALNTIYMLNKRKDNNQVNILLTYLINYFKSVFARQGEMVPLKEEINFMLNYMAIQKFRFAGAMHLQCEIEPEAEISMVPAMCVLTFVENAIKYSTDFSNDLMIVVSAKVEGDNIKIEIQDNGEGIEENILKKINQNEKIVKNDREHIGIKNIVDRMHMHYGEAASVKVTNRDSGGVSVVINVPK